MTLTSGTFVLIGLLLKELILNSQPQISAQSEPFHVYISGVITAPTDHLQCKIAVFPP